MPRRIKVSRAYWLYYNRHVHLRTYTNKHIDGVVPILDLEGNPLVLAKYHATSYDHAYDCDMQRIDTSVFNLYECVCLYGVNEYAVLMCQQCFNEYKWEIVLFGDRVKYVDQRRFVLQLQYQMV